MKHLDEARFEQQAGGNAALMVRVAQAFVGQLPGWRADYSAASDQPKKRIALLHKMKGSCQAITAYGAAESFAKAEKTLQSSLPANADLPDMLALVTELEAELNALIDQHDVAAP